MVNLHSSTPYDVTLRSESSTSNGDQIAILRSIIVTRCKDGATIDEIIGDYKDFTGESLLATYRDRDAIAEELRSIQGVYSTFNAPMGPYLWFCSTQKTQHLSEMIKKQKSPRANRKYPTPRYQPPMLTTNWRASAVAAAALTPAPVSSSSSAGQRDKFFEDNNGYIPKRNGWSRIQQQRNLAPSSHPYLPPPQRRQAQQQRYTNAFQPNFTPLFCGCQMIGDDFFLSLARWELGFLFDPGHNIQRSGLCISGLTIAEAADRVMKVTCLNDRVIVNIGAVDILHGHDYVDMQQDMLQLMQNFAVLGVSVIVTTLSPLASSSHIPGMAERLHQFNDFIRSQPTWRYIDLWKCFVNERESTLYECFQPGPRHVSGSNQPHVLWNKLGRQRIIKFLKTQLARFM